MATKMKLKLKTVFVLYFLVSLMGLVYALMQLGKCSNSSMTAASVADFLSSDFFLKKGMKMQSHTFFNKQNNTKKK